MSGRTVSSDATHTYFTFTSSDNLQVNGNALEVDYLLVGGGGAGGLGNAYSYTTTTGGPRAPSGASGGGGSDVVGAAAGVAEAAVAWVVLDVPSLMGSTVCPISAVGVVAMPMRLMAKDSR